MMTVEQKKAQMEVRKQEPKQLVIGVHGGMVQWACGNAADVEIIVMDFDDDGADENDLCNGIARVWHEEVSPLSDLEPDVAKTLREFDAECRGAEQQ